jgi:glycosyltransferase involved in cell wall biosynthesis
MYSIIVPVYNRPNEAEELLESLTRQKGDIDFEVVIIEDGSSVTCKDVCEKYMDRLKLSYYLKENSGPAKSRNYGALLAKGEYLIILDSDVVVPEGYLMAVDKALNERQLDAFGGPDKAHSSFSDTQKAISYSMTSFFTTGGIRGGKKKLDKFYPRSFNMGIRCEVYNALGGFADMRFGEDVDFSIRIYKGGYRCGLIPEAWVWHKRRTDFRKFFRQVYNSGMARINLYKRHPESLKIVHLLPMVFAVGVLTLVFGSGVLQSWLPMIPLLLFALLIFSDASLQEKSLKIGLLAVVASYIQLLGYGFGFISAWWKRCVLRQGDENLQAFRDTFYK